MIELDKEGDELQKMSTPSDKQAASLKSVLANQSWQEQ